MNTDQIAYLIDIAKTGSINTTAKRMFSSQQAVSEAIKRLENELDCIILHRSRKGVSFTKDGEYVLQQLTPIYAQYQDLQQHLQNRTISSTRALHLATALFATNVFLPELIFKIYRNYPNLTLYTSEMQINEIINQLLQGDLDFGISGFADKNDYMFSLIVEKYQNILYFQPLFTDSVYCVMSKHHPFAGYAKITDEQVTQMKLTSYNYSRLADPMNYLHVSNNTLIHQKFMKEENTVTFVPMQIFKQAYSSREFVAIPFANPVTNTTYLIYRREDAENEDSIFHSFIQTALELAKNI